MECIAYRALDLLHQARRGVLLSERTARVAHRAAQHRTNAMRTSCDSADDLASLCLEACILPVALVVSSEICKMLDTRCGYR